METKLYDIEENLLQTLLHEERGSKKLASTIEGADSDRLTGDCGGQTWGETSSFLSVTRPTAAEAAETMAETETRSVHTTVFRYVLLCPRLYLSPALPCLSVSQ